MKNKYFLIKNVHFNKLATNAMIECVFGMSGPVVMDSVVGIDLGFKLMDLLSNAKVIAKSILCANYKGTGAYGPCLTENAIDFQTMRRML
jgi:hypothetical protein